MDIVCLLIGYHLTVTPRVDTASRSILEWMELASTWVRVFSMFLGGARWIRRQCSAV